MVNGSNTKSRITPLPRLVGIRFNGSRKGGRDPACTRESLRDRAQQRAALQCTHRLVPTTQVDLCIDSDMPALLDCVGKDGVQTEQPR